MAILDQLGINISLFFQMGIFLIVGLIMMNVLFRPYLRALVAREAATVGGESFAAEVIQQTIQIQGNYDVKARAISGDIKTIYDTFRADAQKAQSKLLADAKAESDKLLEAARANVAREIGIAHQNLKEQIPGIVQSIQSKLLQK